MSNADSNRSILQNLLPHRHAACSDTRQSGKGSEKLGKASNDCANSSDTSAPSNRALMFSQSMPEPMKTISCRLSPQGSCQFAVIPEKPFQVRVGYNFRRAQELSIQDARAFSGVSAGFSLKINKLRFSYTHARYTLASHTSLFGVNINLQ